MSATSSPPTTESSPHSQPSPPETDGSRAKKRRTPGSCDHCRKRKAKCDSANMPGNKCTRCTQMGLDCTHDGILKNLGSAKTYVEGLESRLEKCEKILAKMLPDANLSTDLDDIYKRVVLDPSCAKLPRNDDDSEEARLAGRLNYLKLAPESNRFWGRSSNFMFIETALRAKSDESAISQKSILNTHKRPEFWTQRPWQIPSPPTSQPPPYEFPDISLIFHLTDLYFTRVNSFFPLLHRPTFEAGLAENLHHRDRGFAATVLLAIGIGAQYSDDQRVFLEGVEGEHSAGWKFIRQVSMPCNFKQQITLYELQQYALYITYGEAFSWADAWIYLGVALRRALEVGAHRRRSAPPSPELELWKRAFWVLLWHERSLSTFFGRPVGLQEEDFDQEYPIECDDEYWDADFRQPEGKPSQVAMFNSLLRLAEVQAQVLRTVYKTKKHRFSPVIASQQQFISSLDSAMNKWVESEVPEHLSMSLSNGSVNVPLFRQQSSFLYANFYALQLYIHKPFIPLSDSTSVYPSLAISTNAARALLRVLHSSDGQQIVKLPSVLPKTWIAGMILLIHIWSGLRSGLAPNPQKDMEDVSKAMNILKSAENRHQVSGKLRDVLAGLAVAGDLSLPKPGVTSGQKRGREDEPQGGPSSSPSSANPKSPTFDFLFGTDSSSTFQFPTNSSQLSQLPVFDLKSQYTGSQDFSAFTGGDFSQTQHRNAPIRFSEAAFSFTPLGASRAHEAAPAEPQLNHSLTWTPSEDPFAIQTDANAAGTTQANYPPIDAATLGLWEAIPASFNMYDWSNFVDANSQRLSNEDGGGGSSMF